MSTRKLGDAMAKLAAAGELPASRLTRPQREALEAYAQRTGAIAKKLKGAGAVFTIMDHTAFSVSLRELRPMSAEDIPAEAPSRARNIGTHRSSKAVRHGLGLYHLLLRPAPGGQALWKSGAAVVDLEHQCALTGSTAIAVQPGDGWATTAPLWLVENQTNFDDLSWMPQDATGSVALYGGVLDGRLLSWLSDRRRHGGLHLFPDYDGVGLHQYARLAATAPNEDVDLWLFDGWEAILEQFGSAEVWRNTHRHFLAACERFKATPAGGRVKPLTDVMQRMGLALEQEAIWLRGQEEALGDPISMLDL